jgi:NAD(P)-dependent dehydrogenase (short-subunit alcohol dehydrogenase family)
MKLNGKIALIMADASGLGEAIALVCVKNGTAAAIADVDVDGGFFAGGILKL